MKTEGTRGRWSDAGARIWEYAYAAAYAAAVSRALASGLTLHRAREGHASEATIVADAAVRAFEGEPV